MAEWQHILVRAPNWAGDVVMATPGFRALRSAHPRAQIVLHVRAELAPLVAGAPWFDAVVPLASYHRGATALLREGFALRRRRFDLGLCLPDSFSAALMMRCAGVRSVVGYRTQGRAALLDVGVEPPAGLIARERHVLGLIEAIGCAPCGTQLELFVTPGEDEEARAVLAKHQIAADQPLAALAADVACRPCYHRDCPTDHRCMTRLAPERVAAAALPALRGDPHAFRGDGALRALPAPESASGRAS